MQRSVSFESNAPETQRFRENDPPNTVTPSLKYRRIRLYLTIGPPTSTTTTTIKTVFYETVYHGHSSARSLVEQITQTHPSFLTNILDRQPSWWLSVEVTGGADVQAWLNRGSTRPPQSPLVEGHQCHIDVHDIGQWQWWVHGLWFWFPSPGSSQLGSGQESNEWVIGARLW